MSKVIVHRHAANYLKRLPRDTKHRIKNILVQLEQNPLDQPGIKHMAGEWDDYHRIRAGKLRIIYCRGMTKWNEDPLFIPLLSAHIFPP